MAKQFDATLKHLVEWRPLDWLDLAGLPHGESASAVDADVSSLTAAADKVIRVDGPEPDLAHLEFQSGPDAELDHRVMLYNVLLRWRHRMPVRSVVFLLTRKAATTAVSGQFVDEVGPDQSIRFSDHLVSAWMLPIDRILGGGIGTLPLAAVAATENQLPTVIAGASRVAERLSRADADDMLTALYILGGLRHDERMFEALLSGVRNMEESSTYQAIIRKGSLSGELKGRRDDLLMIGRRRFGEPSPEVMAIIDAIHDPQRLATLVRKSLDADSWTEVLAS